MSIRDKLKTVPDLPGAYLIEDDQARVIYVGKARSLRKRLRQHFREVGEPGRWSQVMIQHAAQFEYIVTNSELEALILEANLIKEHRPKYNLRLADDKSYPYLKLTEEQYPRLVLLRDLPSGARPGALGGRQVQRGLHDPHRHEVHTLQGKIFGPYADTRAMRRAVRLAGQLFGLRSCRKELKGALVGTPCLNFHIGRCVGPCAGRVTPEEYAEVVHEVTLFLQGQTRQVERDLESRMQQASEGRSFEQAALLRDKLRALRRTTEEQLVVASEALDEDLVACVAAEDRGLVSLLSVRAGRLIGQDQFALAHTMGRTEAEIIEGFLTEHYSRAPLVPRSVLVSHDLKDLPEWEEMLSELRGSRVEVRRPQRGEKRRLMALALRNAQVALDRLEVTRGERVTAAAEALGDLTDLLQLGQPPRRIECYDVSTLQGRKSTGAQVVFSEGLPDKRHYRHYRMGRTEGKPDDYAMMREMLERRLRRGVEGDANFLPLPDLILVDGGKGQIGVAEGVLAEFGLQIAVAGLAKEEEDVYLPGCSEPLDITQHQRAHLLLQRLRDEAHRFATTYHRSLRDKEMTASLLDAIPGIGPQRKRALLKQFGSVPQMAQASVEELATVPGMNRAVAEALLRGLAE